MTEAERIRKNSFYSFLTVSSRLVANVFIFWIIARFYGPDIFGQFTTAQVLATNFIILADFGFDILLTTEVAKNRNQALKIFQQFFSLKLIFCLVALLLMNITGLLGDFSFQTKNMIFILSFYMAFSSLSNFLSALFKGFEKLEYETRVTLAMNLLLILLSIPLILLRINIYVIALTFVFTRLIGFTLGIFYSKSVLSNISFKFVLEGFNKIRNKVLVFGFFLFFNNLFFQLDTILISLWKNDSEVGIYQAVFKLIMLPLVIPDIITNTLLPTLSRLNYENKEQWIKIGKFINKLLIGIVVPIAIIMFVYAEQIIEIIYGSKNYLNSINVLRIFSLVLFIRFSFEAHALMLTTSDKQHIRLFTVLFATLINLVMNYFLIPIYGALGAALVSLLTNVFVGIVYFIYNIKIFTDFIVNKRIILYLSVSLFFAFILWQYSKINRFLSFFVFSLFFLFGVYFFYLTDEEKRLLLSPNNKIFKK